MAAATNPITFGEAFGIPSELLFSLGVLDVTLALDTKLFIDPLLLRASDHPEISEFAVDLYRSHFEKVIQLLKHVKATGDPAWKAARRLLTFHEVRGTCLGYGTSSIRGSGFGSLLSNKLIVLASQIVSIGIEDPDLFAAMALLEPDIGPDRISDMTTNIIFDALAAFNGRILARLGLTGEQFFVNRKAGNFLRNPVELGDTPLILVPTDVLRDLPIAHDWDSVSDAAGKNTELRDRVNLHIAEIWQKKTLRDKEVLRIQALASKEAFQSLLDAMQSVRKLSYDIERDPEGLIVWATLGQQFARSNPLVIGVPEQKSIECLDEVVVNIIDRFQFLIEHRGLNKELYKSDEKPRHESTAQRLFFAIAYSYCEANNVDISPEIDMGTGKIDFKFSDGFAARVLVEIKLSSNSRAVSGYINQLEEYKAAEQTMNAHYVLIDVGKMGHKDEDLIQARNDAQLHGDPLSELWFIDGIVKAAPSQL